MALSYLIINVKYKSFRLQNPAFNFHTTLYSKHISNFIKIFTVNVAISTNEKNDSPIIRFFKKFRSLLPENFSKISENW